MMDRRWKETLIFLRKSTKRRGEFGKAWYNPVKILEERQFADQVFLVDGESQLVKFLDLFRSQTHRIFAYLVAEYPRVWS